MLVTCGFLHSAHPRYLQHDEAKAELLFCLNKDQEVEITFQLSSRTVTVPISDWKPEHFLFQAVVRETSVEHAAALREWFYSLGNPVLVSRHYRYTGQYLFIPLLKSQEWPVHKIWQLAKACVHFIGCLSPIFLENLQPLTNKINQHEMLRDSILGMKHVHIIETGQPIYQEPLI